MKDNSNLGLDMKPGPKGVRLALSYELLEFISETSRELLKTWNDAETKADFWKALDDLGFELKDDDQAAKYGDRKYKGFPMRGEEFRITVINKGGNLSLDVRNWWS